MAAADVMFVLVGGHAVHFHGYERPMKDLDLLALPTPDNAMRISAALKVLGYPRGLPPGQLERMASSRAKCDLKLQDASLLGRVDGVDTDDAFRESELALVDGIQCRVLSLPHLLATKRACGRPQDTEDVAALIAIALQGDCSSRG